jgi:hypothetical protein
VLGSWEKNHLHQIIYNPLTGGCFNGLEETQINLNQEAESTICYLLAGMTMEKYHNLIETPFETIPNLG